MTDTALIIAHMDKRIAEMKEEILAALPKRKAPTPRKKKGVYGRWKNVRLTDKEYEGLLAIWGDTLEFGVQVLDEYIQAKGNLYKNHAFMLEHKWPAERMREKQAEQPKRSLWG